MNEIFSYFIPRPDDTTEISKKRLAYAYWFVTNFPETEFDKEQRIMWFLVNYSVEIGVPLKERYVTTFLDSELKALLVKNKIKVSGTEQLFFDDLTQIETAVQITKQVMINSYRELMMMDSDLDEFIASADTFMSTQLNESLVRLYSSGYEMMNSMLKGMIGANDALEYTQIQSEQIAEIYDKEKLKELVSDVGTDGQERFTFVSDFGIAAIDKDTGGMYTTQLFGIEAGPGQGKTRFALGPVVYRAAVKYKKNCLYFSLEQSYEEIEAMLISRHMYTLYGDRVPDNMILKKKLPAEMIDKYKAAKEDLFNSNRYGKIKIICDVLYISTFIKRISMMDNLHGPFDLIAIDYMYLIDQKEEKGKFFRRMDDFKVSAMAYKLFKRYLRKTNKVGLAVNQYNNEGTKLAEQDKNPGPTGTAGGMEAHRSADYILSITATEEMKSQRKRRISAGKKRGSEGFDSVVVDVDLGICYFYQKTTNII